MADERVPADRSEAHPVPVGAARSETELRMLEYALNLAEAETEHDGHEITDDEQDALAELRRRLVNQAQAEGERAAGAPVAGFCPMGCGQTLACTSVGEIICHHPDCSRPRAVTELLAVDESEHTVWFDVDTFTVLHPLRERLDDQLVTCALHAHCAALPGPPALPGRYRARLAAGGRWRFEHLGPLTEKERGR